MQSVRCRVPSRTEMPPPLRGASPSVIVSFCIETSLSAPISNTRDASSPEIVTPSASIEPSIMRVLSSVTWLPRTIVPPESPVSKSTVSPAATLAIA